MPQAVVGYRRERLQEILRDPRNKEIMERIRELKPKEIVYYGDAPPDVYQHVYVIYTPEGNLLATDFSEAGMYVASGMLRHYKEWGKHPEELGTVEFYIVVSAVPPQTPVAFPGADLAWRRLQELAQKAGVRLEEIDKRTVTAGQIKEIHEKLVEKYGF